MNDYKALEDTIIEMIKNYPFYACLISLMDKKLTAEVPIAGVSVTSRINLYINPATFNGLSMEIRVGILLHECYHIIHDHIGRSKSMTKTFNKALNIAADRAINEHINVLTKNNKITACIPDSFILPTPMKMKDPKTGEITEQSEMKPVTKKNFQDNYPDKKILDNESMEYYYKFLKENAQKGDGSGADDFEGDTLDDHSKWEEGCDNPEVTKEIIRNAMNKAVGKAAGNVPGDIQIALNELNKSYVSWQHILQRFVAKCVETNMDSSRKRKNKRYGIIHPGAIKTPKLRLGIAVDTSGSVADQHLTQFFSEIKKIHSMGIEIKIVEADYVVQDVFEYDPKKPLTIKGRGGTAFQPAITALEKEKCDAILYFTDGECDEDTKHRKPLMWCLCPSYTIPKNGAKNHIKITIPEKS